MTLLALVGALVVFARLGVGLHQFVLVAHAGVCLQFVGVAAILPVDGDTVAQASAQVGS